jgi:hypothetical protein
MPRIRLDPRRPGSPRQLDAGPPRFTDADIRAGLLHLSSGRLLRGTREFVMRVLDSIAKTAS